MSNHLLFVSHFLGMHDSSFRKVIDTIGLSLLLLVRGWGSRTIVEECWADT